MASGRNVARSSDQSGPPLWMESPEVRVGPVARVAIERPDGILVERLSARRICSCGSIYNLMNKKPVSEGQCDECGGSLIQRDDDRPEVIEERLRVYHNKTEPLIEFYKGKGHYHDVDGAREIEAVFADVRAILEKALS